MAACDVRIPTERLVLAAMVGVIITFTTAYAISFAKGYLFYPYFFLSSSIDNAPASCVGSFGLSLSLVAIPFVSLARFSQIEVRRPRLFFNKVGLLCGLLSAVAGHGVASFQSSHGLPVHLTFAGTFFTAGTAVAVSQCVVDWQTKSSGFGVGLRKVNAFLLFVSLAGMGLIGLVGLIRYTKPPFPPGMTFGICFFELLYFACLLGVYATLYFDLKGSFITVGTEFTSACDIATPGDDAGRATLITSGEKEVASELQKQRI